MSPLKLLHAARRNEARRADRRRRRPLLDPLEGRRLMAADIFLQLGAPEGAVATKASEPAVEVYSFSWDGSNPTTAGSASADRVGKGAVSSFGVTIKGSGAVARELLTDAADGEQIPSAEVVTEQSGGKKTAYLTYDFTSLYVEDVQWSGSSSGDDTPIESVTFGFKGVSANYTPQPDPALDGPIPLTTWHVTTATTS